MVFLFLLATICIIVTILYWNTQRKLQKFREKEEKTDSTVHKKALIAIESSRDKAFEIIQEANRKAQEIIKSTTVIKDESKASLDKELALLYQKQNDELKKSSNELLKAYKELIEDAKDNSISIVKSISKNMEMSALSEIDDFKQILREETLTSQKIVAEKIGKEYEQIGQELKQHKEEELKKIDDALFTLLKKVAEETIGKSIKLEDHEEFILNALDKAKKELGL